MLSILSMLFGLVSLVCVIIILIHAFTKGGVVQGILCLCIPFYVLYYAFAKFEHEKKNLILAGWLGAVVIQVVLILMARQ